MKKLQTGFTLIELMIVVAIIGILAAVAIPSYQDYTKRAHVSEGLSLAGSAKTGIAEYFGSQGVMPTDNTDAGISAPGTITGNAVSSVTVTSGKIDIVYKQKVSSTAGELTMQLSPTTSPGSIKWVCNNAATTVLSKYRPSNCR